MCGIWIDKTIPVPVVLKSLRVYYEVWEAVSRPLHVQDSAIFFCINEYSLSVVQYNYLYTLPLSFQQARYICLGITKHHSIPKRAVVA